MSELPPAREAEFRERLQRELLELTGLSEASAADRAPVKLDQQSVGRLARMDAMQQQAMANATEQSRQRRLASVKAALALIEQGDFGYCTSCDEPIAEARLNIDPAIALCVKCASLHER